MLARLKKEIKKLYASQNLVQQLIIDEFEPRQKFGQYQVEFKLLEGDNNYYINLNDLLGDVGALLLKVLVTGVPGSGGTSVLDGILYKWANNNLFNDKYEVVFRIKAELLLEQWNEKYSSQNIIDYPLECFIHYSLKGVIELGSIISALKNIESHRILFLIDDYHNIPIAGVQQHIMNSIYARGNLIATVSSDSPMDAVNDYSEFDVCILNEGYSKTVMQQYIKDYFSIKITMGVRDFNSEINFDSTYYKIQQLLKNNEQLLELVRIPKFLALLCMYSDKDSLMNEFVASEFDMDVFLEYLFQEDQKFLVQSAYDIVNDSQSIELQMASELYVHDPSDTIEQRTYKVADVIYNRCENAIKGKEFYIKDQKIIDNLIIKLAKSLADVDSVFTDEMIEKLSDFLIGINILDIDVNRELSINYAIFHSRELEYKVKVICNIDAHSRSISPDLSDHYYLSDDSANYQQSESCCIVSCFTEIVYDNFLLNYPTIINAAMKMGIFNRLLELGKEDQEVASCIIVAASEYNKNNPGDNGEKFVLDIIYGEEKANPVVSVVYDLNKILFSASVAFKELDTSIDALRLIYIPTIDNIKILLWDIVCFQSILQGNNAYLLGLSAIDVASLVSQGEIQQATIEASTSIGYMLLPIVISFAPAEYAIAYSAIVVTYTGAKALYNAYSFYQDYQSSEFKAESEQAYKNIFDNWEDIIELYKLDDFYDYL